MRARFDRWLERWLDGRRTDPVVRRYGAFVALGHLAIAVYWAASRAVAEQIARGADGAVCWPFWPSCESSRWLSRSGATVVVALYVALASAAVATLGAAALRRSGPPSRRLFGGGLVVLTLAAAVFGFVWAQDYRLRESQHTTLAWVTALLLVAPSPRAALRLFFVVLYAWAGFLKLNADWLGGSSIYAPYVPPGMLALGCVYVVVLELAVVPWLLLRRRRVTLVIYGQLVLFHGASFFVLEYSYPALMLALTALLPLDAAAGSDAGPKRLFWAPAALFSLLQVVRYTFPGDLALSGEGRLFGIHMFDARVVCQRTAQVRRNDGVTSERIELPPHTRPRIACDPIVVMSQVAHRCAELRRSPGFVDLDALLVSRRISDRSYTTVVDAKDVCRAPPVYRLLRHNAWIFPRPAPDLGRLVVP